MRVIFLGLALFAALPFLAPDAAAWCCVGDGTKVLMQNFKWEGDNGAGDDIDVPIPSLPGVPRRPDLGLPGTPGVPAIPWKIPPILEDGGGNGGGDDTPPPPPPPGGGIGGVPTYWNLYVKPYADLNFWTSYAYSDWHNRIASAYMQGLHMWRNELGVNLFYLSPEGAPHNFGETGDDGGLGIFNGWVVSKQMVGPNSYALFQSFNEPDWNPVGYGGLGYSRPTESYCHTLSYQTTPPPADSCPSNMIVARDWSGSDTYDPDDMWYLGLSANHELTHNAGEPDHPSDNYNCDTNIMQNGVAHWCKNYYRVQQTLNRVKSYGIPRMH